MAPKAGLILKQARLERKLSLEQIAQETKIRARFLEAIENDDRDALPSPVQARGFIRLYAGFLKLDAQPILDLWEGAPTAAVLAAPDEAAQTTTPDDTRPSLPAAPDSADYQTPKDSTAPAKKARGLTNEELDKTEPLLLYLTQDELAHLIPPDPTEEQAEPPAAQAWEQPPARAVEPLPAKSYTASREYFVDIGRRLRFRRESLALSLADVERFAHIRQPMLMALEEGRIDDLPSTVQGRGMLTSYIAFLELEDNEIMDLFTDGLQLRRIERSETTPVFRQQKVDPYHPAFPLPVQAPPERPKLNLIPARLAPLANRIKRFITPDLLIGTALVSVLMGFVLWSVAQLSLPEDTSPYATDVSIAANSTGLPTGGAGQPASDSTAVEASPETDGSPTPAIPASAGPVQVYVVARQRAWLEISVDGSSKFKGRIIPGNAYNYSGSGQIDLVSADAASIQVFFNQEDLGKLGDSGQVVRIRFSREGYTIATPVAAPATPTATPAPTDTPTPTLPAGPTATITPLVP